MFGVEEASLCEPGSRSDIRKRLPPGSFGHAAAGDPSVGAILRSSVRCSVRAVPYTVVGRSLRDLNVIKRLQKFSRSGGKVLQLLQV
jgi:hypothetical protein